MSVLRHVRRMVRPGVGWLTRGYNSPGDGDVTYFEQLLGKNAVLTEDLDFYNEDWLGITKGCSKLVLKPGSTDEVSDILKYCNEKNLPVVPQGGNTGMVTGSIPIKDEIVLSLQRMNKITKFDESFGVIYCDGGTVLQQIEEYGRDYGFTIPHDLGSKGSCTIGGNLGTHAGGLRIVRYGRLRGYVLGMKVVLADGTILDDMTTMRKDNTGYDVKQLFIGSEGTLGVITEVSLLLPPAPKSRNVVLLGCNNFKDIVNVCTTAKRDLGEIVSACEFMDGVAMESVVKNISIPYPLESMYPFFFLVETSGMNEAHDREKLDLFVSKVFEESMCADGIVAASNDQVKEIFSFREMIAVGLKPLGHNYQYDVSVPIQRMEELVGAVKARFVEDDNVIIAAYGHIGDNDIHMHIIPPKASPDVLSKVEPFIYEKVSAMGGSISSEHGIGVQKIDVLSLSKKKPVLDAMRLLKRTLDPKGILNPNKILVSPFPL